MGSKLTRTVCIAQNCDGAVLRRDLCEKHLNKKLKYPRIYPTSTTDNRTFQPVAPRTKGGGTYLIGVKGQPGIFKIGKTVTCVRSRLSTFQVGSYQELYVVACGNLATEEYLHAYFKDKRIRGEWFELTHEELKTAVKLICDFDELSYFRDK